MTTLSIFKGHKNTLSYNASDTHHREIKDFFSKSQDALKDLTSLIALTKGNNIDNHFLRKTNYRMDFKSNNFSSEK